MKTSGKGESVGVNPQVFGSVSESNNGMHPTANSIAFIRKTPCLYVECAAGDAGR